MKSNWIDRLIRLTKLIACLAVAAFVVWHGDIAPAGNETSILSALISAMFAILILATGVALTLSSDESP